jgi:hypothetical protein
MFITCNNIYKVLQLHFSNILIISFNLGWSINDYNALALIHKNL